MIYRKGSRGEVVRQIQIALAGAGYRVFADGIFGSITEEAVMAFQRDHADKGLKVDGIVGPATMAFLIPCRWKKSKRVITEIVVHCTDTKEYQDFSVADIRRWHTTPTSKGGRGWSDIGYHYVVYLDGSIHEGRSVDLVGAHVSGHNTHSIGVVYVGGRSASGVLKDTRTELQKVGLLSLLTDLKALYPQAKIYGHRDFDKSKACPCFDAKKEYMGL